jgi:hypothetical protein
MRRPVVVCAVLLVLLTGTVGGCSRSAARKAAAPTIAAAQALLAREAHAVLTRNEPALLTGLDPAPAAQAYRAEQTSEFANLAEVPLALWRYRLVGPIRDSAAIRAADRDYDAPVLLLHVTLQYELRGIDTAPDRHDLYLIFVERAGQTLLAGDDALATQGTPSWIPPWHYGALLAARGTVSLVLGPPSDRAQLSALAAAVDSAVTAVTHVWGTGWARRVAVLIPASMSEFRALSGTGTTDVSAAALTGGIDPVTDRPYGQRLVPNPAQLGDLTATGRGIVLRHEVTHLATAADSADITPRWLVEGFADYVGNLGSGQPVRVAAAELRTAVAHGTVSTQLPPDGAFGARGAALARAYEASWLACRLIAQRVGQAGLVRFYRAVGTALSPRAQALAHAFRSVLRETQRAFTVQWRGYLKTELS